jgi:hypothetical protein
MMSYEELAQMRARRNNIRRYRRLLGTELTDLERNYIERRLAEERSAFESLMASAFPMTFTIPPGSASKAQAMSGS